MIVGLSANAEPVGEDRTAARAISSPVTPADASPPTVAPSGREEECADQGIAPGAHSGSVDHG
jgi:hypothetical protein